MDITAMLREFCDAVERRDGDRFASLFCEDAVYHDLFYGAFAGRANIAAMINDVFYKDAAELRWDMLDPISDGRRLYARYTFSYKSLLPEAGGNRAVFEGVAIMTLRDGRIAEYREIANPGTAFVDMNFSPARITTILEREASALKARPEAARHLA
jgi:ketosteroid isomerase-like protein